MCISLETIYIGTGLNEVRVDAFYNCNSLMDVYYSKSASDFSYINIYSDNGNLLNATLHPYTYTHVHTWDSGVVTTTPTCISDGEMLYTCTLCGATRTETISDGDHNWDSKRDAFMMLYAPNSSDY